MKRSDQLASRRLLTGGLSTLVVLACLATPVVADNPKGEELMAKYIEATGGEALHRKAKTRVVTGTIEIPGASIKGSMTITAAAPNRTRAIIEIDGMGKTDRGTDGTIAWEVSTMQGARVLEGLELSQFMRESDFYGTPNWKKHYKKLETVGEDKVGERSAWKVEATPNEGAVETMFFDKETHLLIKQIGKFATPMGEIEAQTLFEDYATFDGLKMPKTVRQTVMGQQQVMKFDSMKHDVELPKDAFAVPEDVKALKKSDAKTDEKPSKP